MHAAAVIKAQRKGLDWLADRVYSGVPASWIGRTQEIEVGHMSGASNVIHYLKSRSLPFEQDVIDAVLTLAKKSAKVLDEEEILSVVKKATR